jgi:hypothetical protein
MSQCLDFLLFEMRSLLMGCGETHSFCSLLSTGPGIQEALIHGVLAR